MSKINQKLTMPRMHGGNANVLRRSDFLHGGKRTFFGPGQAPSSPYTYRNPTEWMDAGRLIRMPQVVWLTALVNPTFYQGQFDESTHVRKPIAIADQVQIDYGVADPVEYHYASNQNLTDYQSFQAKLSSVKSQIDAIRNGRTWVHIVDWLTWAGVTDSDPAFQDCSEVGDPNDFDFRYLADQPSYLHLRSPLSDAENYLGVDFLHVYAGHWARDDGARQFTTVDVTPVIETDAYISDKANIVAQADKFRRFALRCYGYTQSWDQYPLAEHGDDFAGPGGGTFNDFIRTTNAFNSDEPVNSNGVLSDTCSDLASALTDSSADIQYAGLLDDVSADEIVQAIAEHFGFDPRTGKDLG